MSTSTNDTVVCPSCNVEMTLLGRRAVNAITMTREGFANAIFHVRCMRCPVCQIVIFNQRELAEQAWAKQMKFAYSAGVQTGKLAIASANKIHERRKRIGFLWFAVGCLTSIGAAIGILDSNFGLTWVFSTLAAIAAFNLGATYRPVPSCDVWAGVDDSGGGV